MKPSAMNETLDAGLFRSVGRRRLGFSHRTYAEYLAAGSLADRKLPAAQILRFVLHEDGSDKVVHNFAGPPLAGIPGARILQGDSDEGSGVAPAGWRSDAFRGRPRKPRAPGPPVIRIPGSLFDERVIGQVGAQLAGARLTHAAWRRT